MTTRLELRTALRRRLEDTGAAPLWDDATLNDALVAALRRYGAAIPAERTLTATVAKGATSVPVAGAVAPERIVRVLDERGATVPRQREAPGQEETGAGTSEIGLAQAWRWWDRTLRLQRPAVATGAWRIEHLDAREVPTDDLAAVDIENGDEEVLLALAAATALHRRTIEDAKRGVPNRAVAAAATAAEAGGERLLATRRRRVRSAWLG